MLLAGLLCASALYEPPPPRLRWRSSSTTAKCQPWTVMETSDFEPPPPPHLHRWRSSSSPHRWRSSSSPRRAAAPRCCSSAPLLAGTSWTLSLDVGVERGTWMPPTWGRSGARALAKVEVRFEADGRLSLQSTGPWDHLTVRWATEEDGATIGRYTVDGERATLYLAHEGLERGDVRLEPGRLYATAGAWGALLGRRGNLSIKQRKFGWMPFLPTLSEASFRRRFGHARRRHQRKSAPFQQRLRPRVAESSAAISPAAPAARHGEPVAPCVRSGGGAS